MAVKKKAVVKKRAPKKKPAVKRVAVKKSTQTTKVAAKAKAGRPTDFSPKLGTTICARLIEIGSLRKVCSAEDMPSKTAVFRWLAKGDEDGAPQEYGAFRDQYARARRLAKEYRFDEHWEDVEETALVPVVVEGVPIIDPVTKEVLKTVTPQSVGLARLKHDAFKWQASKEDPKKYGERVTQELVGKGGGAIETTNKIDLSDLTKDERAALAGVLARRVTGS